MRVRKIIFHVGPGKCGSTTIQQHLAATSGQCEGFAYRFLGGDLLATLEDPSASPAEIPDLATVLARTEASPDTVIISQEFLFQAPDLLERLVRSAATEFDEIRIVGYSRRPSDFIQSAYCQWHFRSAERLDETIDIVRSAGLQPDLFSGLERHFIAAIETDFRTARQLSGANIVHWCAVYDEIAAKVKPFGAILSVGCLPAKGSGESLLADFFRRCAIEPDASEGAMTGPRGNPQFSLDLVEAVSIAICNGIAMPGPHEDNEVLESLSRRMGPGQPETNELISQATCCVDTMLWEENRRFAATYGLSEKAFRPAVSVFKDEFTRIARDENARRLADPHIVLQRRNRLIATLARLGFDLEKVAER